MASCFFLVPVRSRCDVCNMGGGLLEGRGRYVRYNRQARNAISILCSASKGRRGFGRQPTSKDKSNKADTSRESGNTSQDFQQRKSAVRKSDTVVSQAPGLAGVLGGKSGNEASDQQFDDRLEAVRRSAVEKKKAEERKAYEAIDYDAPVEPDKSSIGFGTKVGVGVAVVVFGLVFAFGDFLPSGSLSPSENTTAEKKLTDEEKATLQNRLQQFEEKLKTSPKDEEAIEGAAVTLAELGEYTKATSLLEKLIQERPGDSEAYRLLGDIKFELKDYDGSAVAYKNSASAAETIDLEILRGLTNALLAAKKPDEAVQILLASREALNSGSLDKHNAQSDGNAKNKKEIQKIDPIQVELLLGKAYSDWGHVSDAVSVYDRLISMYPDDFRGYLAKGIILKENGNVGDAERMFIQARFFAPEKVKALVDQYSKQ